MGDYDPWREGQGVPRYRSRAQSGDLRLRSAIGSGVLGRKARWSFGLPWVHGVDLKMLTVVTSYGLAGADIFLGQSVWASHGVALVVRAEKATLYKAEAIEEVFTNFTLAEECDTPERAIRVAVPIIVKSGETAAVAARAYNCLASELLRSSRGNGAELLVCEGDVVGPNINEILVTLAQGRSD
ncbi:hypothetical protein QE152_g35307 [Popillia japonica]|uniref:Uncharacterized protein n=1 Tax=Popillia japonica TaxID=7064 RepID=A0AAW1IFF4_POPJA